MVNVLGTRCTSLAFNERPGPLKDMGGLTVYTEFTGLRKKSVAPLAEKYEFLKNVTFRLQASSLALKY